MHISSKREPPHRKPRVLHIEWYFVVIRHPSIHLLLLQGSKGRNIDGALEIMACVTVAFELFQVTQDLCIMVHICFTFVFYNIATFG